MIVAVLIFVLKKVFGNGREISVTNPLPVVVV